uniref:Uncharacterized protein n=1 Tax=Physcomitrium patens TaxID=3218 RepID=A0A2K1KC66_PHYPA|nr:hypothetical protein PHYPA_010547 [Physcomitrium patens]
MLYSTKAYTFLEKLCHKLLPASKYGVQKSMLKMNEFSCRFYNQVCRLSEECKTSKDDLKCSSPKNERLSFDVTTYRVPLHNVAQRLLKKKWVQIPVRDLDSKSHQSSSRGRNPACVPCKKCRIYHHHAVFNQVLMLTSNGARGKFCRVLKHLETTTKELQGSPGLQASHGDDDVPKSL